MKFENTISLGDILFFTWPLVATYLLQKLKQYANRFRVVLRGRIAKTTWQMRRDRRNPAAINYIGNLANVYFALFVLFTGFVLIALVGLPELKRDATRNTALMIYLATPMIVFELLWLSKRDYAKKVIHEHGKLLRYRGL